jgi:hypothetical protein
MNLQKVALNLYFIDIFYENGKNFSYVLHVNYVVYGMTRPFKILKLKRVMLQFYT